MAANLKNIWYFAVPKRHILTEPNKQSPVDVVVAGTKPTGSLF